MRLVTLTTILTAVALSSCGYIKAKTGAGDKTDQIDLKLTGTWDGPCYNRAVLGTNFAKDSTEFLPNGGFRKRTQQYSDASCSELLLIQDISGTYDANLGGAPNTPNAQQINYTVTQLAARPENQATATHLNDAKFCGITHWKSEETQDILGKNCPAGKYEKGEVVFDIYSRDNDTIYFGKSNFWLDESSARQRPISLDTEHAFHKK